MDGRRDDVMPLFREVYGDDAGRWFQRWRIFFLACSELFAYRNGNEWWVSHYRLASRAAGSQGDNRNTINLAALRPGSLIS